MHHHKMRYQGNYQILKDRCLKKQYSTSTRKEQKMKNNIGILFQPPSEAEHDLFWDDDYEKGSFKVWLKKKYIGPYIYGGTMEDPEIARQDVEELLEHFKMIEVRESFSEYMKRKEEDENTEIKIIKKVPLIDLTLEEMNASIIIDGGTESLLERIRSK